MVSREENELLCRVGPGTPMGDVMRRYWHPICTSAEIAAKDSAPLRVQLLGENLIAFRDSDGKVGVMEEGCLHRGASLALGRVEGGGIRCLFHGWKFAVDGTILETPNHRDCAYRDRFKAAAFPTREEGGLVWAYIGPPEKEPPFRRFGFMEAAEQNRAVIRVNVKANYLQLWEGGADSSHVGVLHSNVARPGWMDDNFTPVMDEGNPGWMSVEDNAPALEIEPTDYGYHYAAIRRDAAGNPALIRLVPIIMPYCRIIPSPAQHWTVFETPASDESTSTFIVIHSNLPVDRNRALGILGLDDERFWNDQDCNLRLSWANNMGQVRSRMADNWSGIANGGIELEDAAIGLSPGPILDRTKEHLIPADQAVVRLRRLLTDSARRVAEGGDPIGVRLADLTRLGASADLPLDGRWQDHAQSTYILPEKPAALEPAE